VRIDSETTALTVVSGALGIVAALTLSAPTALADPAQSEPVMPVAAPAVAGDPVPPIPAPAPAPAPAPVPAPEPAVAQAVVPAAVPAVAPADPAIPTPAPMPGPGPAPGPAPDGTVQAAPNDLPVPPDGLPHLSSPENLPPGTTDTPPDAGQPRTLGYLRDLWHAVQTQEVSGADALLLLTQRPMNPNAAPPPGMSANPTPPLAPEPAPPPPAEPAPALLPEPAPPPPAEPAPALLPEPAPPLPPEPAPAP
jgi:resuscitation-promoting factor RpfA